MLVIRVQSTKGSKVLRFYLITCTIVVGLLSCNSANSGQTTGPKSSASVVFDMEKARAITDSANKKFSELFKNGDSAALASYYSDDAEMLLPNRDPIKGKDIAATWNDFIQISIKNSARNLSYTSLDLTGDSNFIIESGIYELKDDGGKVQDKGKYLVIWKQQNGQWKLFRDIGV